MTWLSSDHSDRKHGVLQSNMVEVVTRKLSEEASVSLEAFTAQMLPAVEKELQRLVARLDAPRTALFHEMLTYHLGWTGEGAGPAATGKRLRPLLLLLTCAAVSETGNQKEEQGEEAWLAALPAAAAVELIHNFSLVHDDIQDNSALRRGRPTVWKKWGVPQAINAGDALFILAQLALLELENRLPPAIVLRASRILQEACLALCNGQFLDLDYQEHADLTLEDYWPMVAGKTAALFSACAHLGALLGGADEALQEAYRNFGHYLGLAFQVQDDYLGIWGEEALLGKSTASDLMEGKKSFPVLCGLEKNGAFARRWKEGPLRAEEVALLADLLAQESVKLRTLETVDAMTDLALKMLLQADPSGAAGEALFELVNFLLRRQA